jgi:hypothetical protein
MQVLAAAQTSSNAKALGLVTVARHLDSVAPQQVTVPLDAKADLEHAQSTTSLQMVLVAVLKA